MEVESGLSCLIDLLGLSRGDGRGWKVGSGVVARGGGEVARRDSAEWRVRGGLSHYRLSEGGYKERERVIRETANHLRQALFFDLSQFRKKCALRRGICKNTGEERQRGEDPKAERFIQFPLLHLVLPGWPQTSFSGSFDMKLFIISVPALVFFGLLSCAAPVLHMAGPLTAPSTAPFPNGRALVMGYYPDWASHSLPPEKIDFSRFDWIDFAFALPDQSFALTWDDPANAPPLLDRLISSAHAAGKHVKLSIGGWTGSQLRIFTDALDPIHPLYIDISPLLSRRTETGRSLPPTS